MIELKPCPFCGGEADCSNSRFIQYGRKKWAVECPCCGVVSHFFDTEEEAIAAWNRRTDNIDAVPAKHGWWEEVKEWDFKARDYFIAGYTCSCCGTWYFHPQDTFKHCPSCGAKMDGEPE